MSPRRKTEKPANEAKPAAPSPAGEVEDEDPVAAVDDDVEVVPVVAAADDDEELIEDDLEDDEDDRTPVAVVAPVAAVRPPPRPSPGRPPSAKEEPEPPFYIGEKILLISNTRPRTGTPIGDHPVGATGRVETVLSQTAIVRFDRAPDTKEVVAFTCLESIDDDAKARRAEREKELAREAKEREKEKELLEKAEKAKGR